METIKSEKIYAFDSLYTTNHIEILKILLPCFNPPLQRNLALYIKFLELRYTISFLNAHPYAIKGCGFDKAPMDWEFLKNDLSPYLTPQEAGRLRQIQKSVDRMKQFSSIQKNLEALKDILPEGMDLETFFQSMMGGSEGHTEKSPDQSAQSRAASEDDRPNIRTSDEERSNNEAYRKNVHNNTPSNNRGQNSMVSEQPENSGFSPKKTGDILKAVMNKEASSSEDILKNMMSSSQQELFQKFNERFKDI